MISVSIGQTYFYQRILSNLLLSKNFKASKTFLLALELLQIVMFSLYGNQYEAREEHLLLKMFELALQMEFDETDDFNNLMRANTAISRMITAYTRRGPGQEYLKETLQQLVEDTNSRTDINLEVNPVKVSIDQLLDSPP